MGESRTLEQMMRDAEDDARAGNRLAAMLVALVFAFLTFVVCWICSGCATAPFTTRTYTLNFNSTTGNVSIVVGVTKDEDIRPSASGTVRVGP